MREAGIRGQRSEIRRRSIANTIEACYGCGKRTPCRLDGNPQCQRCCEKVEALEACFHDVPDKTRTEAQRAAQACRSALLRNLRLFLHGAGTAAVTFALIYVGFLVAQAFEEWVRAGGVQ